MRFEQTSDAKCRTRGQNELQKKTGIEPNLSRSMWMPVVTGLPVFGHRIMSSPIGGLFLDAPK
jgi:hypothetical protein